MKMAVVKMARVAASRAAQDSLDLHDEPGSVLRKSGVGPGFQYSVLPISPFRSPDERSDIRERLRGFIAAPRVSLRSPGLQNN